MVPAPLYCIDTSAILVWFVDTYPPAIFPGLQTRIEELIAAGRLRSPKAVFDEIRPGDDCHLWCKAQTELFIEEPAAVQRIVSNLMATHHDPQKPHKGINGADPFVIAMAKAEGPHCKVVADEHPGSQENRKIPFVCNAEGVQCITFQQLMLAEGWKFR
jgi:Domain of unknown function (DUF4411)